MAYSVNGEFNDWEALTGSITVEQAALGTDKSTSVVDALADANKLIYTVVEGTIGAEFRIKGVSTNNDSNTMNIYALSGTDDDYIPIATLTLLTGQQSDDTNNYIDDITEAVKFKWPTKVEVMTGFTDGIARFALNTHGYRKFLFIITSKAAGTTSIKIDSRRLAA